MRLTLPEDPMMLYSVVNAKLRDEYASLDDLCHDMGVERSSIEKKLQQAGFEYDATHNRFW